MGLEQDLATLQALALSSSLRAASERKRQPLVDLSHLLHRRADAAIDRIQQANPPPACRRGCSFCCHGLIPTTLPELLDLLELVSSWDESALNVLRQNLDRYATESKAYWRYDLHHFAASCPFLVDDACTVYEHRPLFCRGKNSYEPKDCEQQMLGRSVPLAVVPGQYEAGQLSVTAIIQGLKQSGRYSGTYDLGASIRILLDQPGAAEQVGTGETNPLSQAMMGSDVNVRLKPLDEAGQAFIHMPDFAHCFGPGVTPEQQYSVASRLARQNPYAVSGKIVLPTFYDSEDELEEWWGRYEAALDELEGLELDPRIAFAGAELGAANTFGLAYNGKNTRPAMERLARIFHGYARSAYPLLTAPIERPRRPGPFRLGYVSRRLIFNNGSRWALGWVTEHRPDIETYAFNLNESDDQMSTRWRRNVDHYYHLPIPTVEAAAQIRSLDLDALIFTDVGTDGTTFQLSLLRTARSQMAAWGFPMTTGSPEMDFYLSSKDMEPPNGQEHYTEKLVLLPGSGLTFPKARKSQPSAKSAQDFGLPQDGFLLIAQNPVKLLPRRDRVFAEISRRTGKPIVICDSSDGVIGERVYARMRRAGVDVRRVGYLPDTDFFRLMQLAEVVLDSFDFGGGVTTVDALTLRRTPVACPGEFMRGRLCIPFMKAAGVADTMTSTPEEYIDLASDKDRIAEAEARCDPEPIYRDTRSVKALEESLLNLA